MKALLRATVISLEHALNWLDPDSSAAIDCRFSLAALQAAIDQPEPEPDAYLVFDKASSSQYACLDEDLGDMDDCEVRPLYTRPVLAKPLTDEQIKEVWLTCPDGRDEKSSAILFARAIEAAHGIREAS